MGKGGVNGEGGAGGDKIQHGRTRGNVSGGTKPISARRRRKRATCDLSTMQVVHLRFSKTVSESVTVFGDRKWVTYGVVNS
jgi:hypothetical protein